MQATWAPHEKHGQLTAKGDLPDTVFAFPKQRKEPLTDAKHVRNAVARFDQVIDVSDEDRKLAFANIKKAARHYEVDLSETSWRELGAHPQPHRRKPPPKPSGPNARAGNSSPPPPKAPQRASANAWSEAVSSRRAPQADTPLATVTRAASS